MYITSDTPRWADRAAQRLATENGSSDSYPEWRLARRPSMAYFHIAREAIENMNCRDHSFAPLDQQFVAAKAQSSLRIDVRPRR